MKHVQFVVGAHNYIIKSCFIIVNERSYLKSHTYLLLLNLNEFINRSLSPDVVKNRFLGQK